MKLRIALAGLLVLSPAAQAFKDRDWKMGKLLDSQSAKTFVQTGSSTQAQGTAYTSGSASTSGTQTSATTSYGSTTTARGTSETQIHNMAIQETQLLIVTGDFLSVVSDSVQKGVGAYGALARAIENRKHGCHVIVNDPIKFAQEKNAVYVIDVEGEECKKDLVRQERVSNVAPEPAKNP
jgi:hypothetical protein